MDRPSVLVLPMRLDYATPVVNLLRAAGRYDVVAPGVTDESWDPETPFAAVITTRHLTAHPGVVIVELPESLDQPITIKSEGVTVAIKVDQDQPFDGILTALDEMVPAGQAVAR